VIEVGFAQLDGIGQAERRELRSALLEHLRGVVDADEIGL
jgi:hypothetical protein